MRVPNFKEMGDMVILAQAAISNTRDEVTQTVDICFSQSLSLRNSRSKCQQGGFHLEMARLGLYLDAWLPFCCLCVWGCSKGRENKRVFRGGPTPTPSRGPHSHYMQLECGFGERIQEDSICNRVHTSTSNASRSYMGSLKLD